MSDFSLDDPSFYEDFLVEAGEHFELIEQNFLVLESNPGDLDILNGIFRSVHTIKGASGFLGLPKVQSLAHIGENILDELRKGRMVVSPEVMELLFETVDMLKVLVDDVGVNLRKQGTPADPDTSDLIQRLETLRNGGTSPVTTAPAAAQAKAQGTLELPAALRDLDAPTRRIIEDTIGQGVTLVAIKAELQPEIHGTAFNPLSMLSMADLVGRLVHSSHVMKEPTDLDAFQADQFHFDLVLFVEATDSVETVQKIFDGVKNVRMDYFLLSPEGTKSLSETAHPKAAAPSPAPISLALDTPEPLAPPAAADSGNRKAAATPEKADKGGSDTIRVSQAKLDAFMNTVAELIICKTMISHVVDRCEVEITEGPASDLVKELRKSSVYLDQVSKEIQASVLGIRMVPVKTIFSKFPRMLRDLAKASGKKIELQMIGEDTEIDKSLIEELSDPLIHLIRNSADHGVEMPEARLKSGKAETGTVILRARHEGDSVLVEIEDDGKGIDPTVIRAKAVEKGLLSTERAEAMSDEEAINMIFLPGFSTAAKVTDISGRGVGMDVVRSNVRRLNGHVTVQSVVGKGSVFTLKLPLTLAIIDALLMRSGGQVFALPGTAVEETLLVTQETLSHLTRRKAINLRGEVLGVTRLRELLNFRDGDDAKHPEGEELPVVVISTAGRRMGLIVDAFIRRQEMVIKPLAPYLASLPGISGASVMGDGGVVLILDPAELMTLAVQEAL